ncbi:hypothetical protein LPJ66_002107 [Kickxella alabastrina]|uniref:Uncharacterized protein n=1 Tax=Kickxella alabastrina TaxID=61397 RepID=A0ACC1IRF2_9FUNG|nr:hypothetical protein LPJ66_002107 [Kickxella alabastrina]
MGNGISFAVTESELDRQIAGEGMELRVDPRGKADAIMIVVVGVLYMINFLSVLYLLWNRKYPPLKAKNPALMALLMAIFLVWYVGDLQIDGHLPLANTPLANCKAFGLWMRILIGVCGMLSLIALRAYGLYRVFVLNRPYHSLALYLPFAIYWVCISAYGIVIQTLNPSKTTHYVPGLDICDINSGFKISMFVVMWISLWIVMFAHWMIRNIKSSFNESREMVVTCSILLAVLIYETVINYVRPMYPLNVSLRIITTVLNHFATNSLWWTIMAVPMYKSIFQRQRYLNQWVFKLRMDGLQKEYEVDSDKIPTNHHRSLLMTSTTGNKDGGEFYPIDNCIYENIVVSRRNPHSSLSQSSKIPLFTNGDSAYDQARRGQHTGDAIMDSLPLRNQSISPKLTPQLYTPISFPEDPVMVRVKPGADQRGNSNHYEANDRYLI